MSTTYTKDEGSVARFVDRVMKAQHAALKAADVTLEILLASNADEPPVKHGGYAVLTVIKANSLKDRTAGLEDSRLVIDEARWSRLSAGEKEALIDHELTHLQLVRDKEGGVKRDDLGRPKLRLKLHDWQLGGFDVIIERHGHNAPEAQAAATLYRRLKQLTFDWTAAEAAGSHDRADDAAA